METKLLLCTAGTAAWCLTDSYQNSMKKWEFMAEISHNSTRYNWQLLCSKVLFEQSVRFLPQVNRGFFSPSAFFKHANQYFLQWLARCAQVRSWAELQAQILFFTFFTLLSSLWHSPLCCTSCADGGLQENMGRVWLKSKSSSGHQPRPAVWLNRTHEVMFLKKEVKLDIQEI